MFFAKQHHKKGFTLAETILVVAIIAILLAVAAPNVLAYYRQLKLTGLDDDAKTIFMAAQSRLTAMLSAGEELEPKSTTPASPANSFGEGSYTETPTAAGAAGGAGDPTVNFWYIDTDYSDLHNYVPGGSIESQLQDNKFVVEFNPDTGAVYAVWYWESDNDNFTYNPTYFEDDISRDTRLDKMVGYYGGSEVDRLEVGQLPIPELNIINAEELRLDIKLSEEKLKKATSTSFGFSDLTVDIYVNGASGKMFQIVSEATLKDGPVDGYLTGSVVLDTLKKDLSEYDATESGGRYYIAGNKFRNWKDVDTTTPILWDDATNTSGIKAGDDITVTVVLSCDKEVELKDAGKGRLISQSASAQTNSLFAGLEEIKDEHDGATGKYTALIAYGRHLQNLHDSGSASKSVGYCSGVSANESITNAKQIRDINFTLANDAEPIKSWASTYKDDTETEDHEDKILDFHPVHNPKLGGYDGGNFEIRNMNAGHYQYGGLFSYINGGTYKDIVIVNPHIHAEGEATDVEEDPAKAQPLTAGALTALASGEVTIENCRVYNEYDEEKDDKKVEALSNGTLKLDDLAMYYDKEKVDKEGNDYKNSIRDKLYVSRLLGLPHIGAPAAGSESGGLVGSVMVGGDVTIINSFASVINIGARNVGGLVGISKGKLTIEGSYSASYVYGNRNVAGLVGLVEDTTKTTTITNSYAAGEIVNGYDKGFKGAGLFHYNNEATASSVPANITVENCYAAVVYDGADGTPRKDDYLAGATTSSVVGFIYGTFKGDKGNYYIAQSGIKYGFDNNGNTNLTAPAESECGKQVTAAELITNFMGKPGWTEEIAEMANGTRTAAAGSSTFTHPYRLLTELEDLPDVYPYPMLVTTIKDVVKEDGTTVDASLPMEHYGDWVVGANGEATAAYIEKYDDDTYGVYAAKMGADGKVSGTIYNSLDDKVVVDDYYAFISPSNPGEFTLDGGADKYTLTEVTIDAELQKEIGAGMKLYTPDSTPNWDSVTNYYHTIKFEASGKTYLYNTSFACEAFDVTEYVDPAVGGTVNTETILEKPNAAGPGHSFTDGANNLNKATGVVIRSARQLANIQKYTNDANAPKDGSGNVYGRGWTYEQLAKIDFDAYKRTGFNTGKTDNDATRLTPALLETGSYYGHQYEISNLYIGKGSATDGAGLFERVGGTGNPGATVNGVRLVNVDVKGGDAKATGGLVGMLYGIVDDCGIYVEAETGSDITASYKKWTVSGTGSNGVGGLIGDIVSSNGNGAKTSFASVMVDGTGGAGGTGNGPVGGFAGQFHSGTVENCYSGGFVEEDTTGTRTYVPRSVNVTGGGSVGGFAGYVATGSATFSGIDYSTASVGGPDSDKLGLFAGEVATNFSVDKSTVMLNAVAKAFKADTAATGVTTYTETAPRDEADYMGGTVTGIEPAVKQPYNQLSTAEFPFPSGQTVHHGDWIEVEAMGVYYDTVNGVTGYYANGKKIDGQTELVAGKPGDGQVATDDGYMFVTEKDLGELSIKIDGKDFTMTKEDISSSPLTINGKTYNYKYEVPAEAMNTPTPNYYTAVSINGKIFYANFGVACEIFDSSHGGLDKPWAKSGIKYTTVDASGAVKTEELNDPAGTGYTGVVVRSARQLANIGIRSNMGEYNASNTKDYTPAASAIQEAAISQVLDIDYSKYTAMYEKAGAPVTKIPDAAVLEGSKETPNHTPITINGGSYDGHEYEIRNLVPGMVRFYDNDENQAYIESGLVGQIKKGGISNVTLINATVENNATDGANVAGSGGSGGTTGGDITRTLKGQNDSSTDNTLGWAGLSVGDISENTDKTSTDNYFSMHWGSKSAFQKPNNKLVFDDGETTSYRVRFGGGISNNYVSFKTENPATIKVYWQATGTNGRYLCIRKDGTDESDTVYTTKGNVTLVSEQKYITTFEATDSGTYYIGSETAAIYISIVRVTEHVKAPSPGGTTPTNPGEDKFPSVAANRFKACFGTLVGATIPSATADGTVKIENCGAYVEPEGATVNTEAYTNAYNKFMVKNSGSGGFKEDTVGGLIGMATQGATIDRCYAAVKVAGEFSVGGFAGHLKDVTVKDCYSGGHTVDGIYSTSDYNVTARNTGSGSAGGFVGVLESTGTETLSFGGDSSVCYSTASAKGGKRVGNFAGAIPDESIGWSGFGKASVYGLGILDGPERTDERIYLDVTVPMRAFAYAQRPGATPYDDALRESTTTTYPYEVPKDYAATWVHHGDWPMRYNIVYYELYKEAASDYFKDSDGNRLKNRDINLKNGDETKMGADYIGFYGVFPAGAGSTGYRVVNTLRVDGYVYKSGYMLVSDAEVDKMRLDIHSYYADSTQRKAHPDIDYDDPDVTQPTHTTVAETTVRLDFEKYNIKNKNDNGETSAAELLGKHGYILPDTVLNVAASKHFYTDTQINGQTYLFNPQFPYEAVNVGIEALNAKTNKYEIDYKTIRPKYGINYVYKDKNGDTHLVTKEDHEAIEDTLIIRSALSLAGMARYSRPSNNGLVKNEMLEYHFEQHMDVDYSKYAENAVYDGCSHNRSDEKDDPLGNDQKIYNYHAGQSKEYGQVPAMLNEKGSYNGFNHTISNLYLSNDSSVAYYVGLFGELAGTVENLKLENIYATSGKLGKEDTADDDNGSVNVGALAAVVTSTAKINNVQIDGVTIDLTDYTSKEEKGVIKYTQEVTYGGVGGAIGVMKDGTGVAVSDEPTVKNVTVTDPNITVDARFSKKLHVGGFVGRADGNTYSTSAGTDTRSVKITDSGVFMSTGNKEKFNDWGVNVTGAVTTDYSGGFAGYLGKGVNVKGDYAAIRVQGKTYAGGFAGQIEGSHVESCYSGGYLDPTNGNYSTDKYNVEAKTAGGFAGKIDLARQSSSSSSMALYMKGHNYTTSSVGGETRGQFAGEFSNADLEALNKKMGAKAPVLYAVGKVKDDETNKLTGVYTGSATPRGTNTFEAVPYYDGLGTTFPYATDNLGPHHGDWVDCPLNAVGYWEVENGLLRLRYIPADAPDQPVEMLESGAAIGFVHDSRDAMGITDSGYFVVSSDKGTTFGITGMTPETTYAERVKELLGGDSVAIEVYALNSSKSENQKWEVGGETFTVNPAYGMAIEHGATSTMGASADKAYQIRTVGQLENMGGAENTMYFQQTHDIVFDSSTGSSYTSPTSFGGYFDGGFYRIIDNTKPVFDTVVGSSATDPIIKNVIVYAPEGNTTINGNGGLAASTSGDVEISNTIVAGFTISGSGNVGGLVGEVKDGSLTIKNSEATNTLTGGSSSNVGGLVGSVASGAALTIERSYAGGYIKKEGSTKVATAGGLVGFASTPENVSYENVYSYVNMMDASADTYYGIGPGSVNPDSVISNYWATGLDSKKASDSDANIKGVTLAEMKLHTQAMDGKPDSVTVEEYLKPDSNRDEGLENHVTAGMTEADKFGVFPFAAFVTGKDTNYHYGDYPEAEYVGLYYYEKEVIFDAKNPMETNATTGKITNEDEARTEYNYYAYGGELFDADGDGTSEIYGQRVLDTLCYDHHLTGEYAYIAESGYGYFYPGAEGTFTATVKDFNNAGNELPKDEEKLVSGDAIRDNLLKKLGVAGTENFQVYTLKTSTGPRTETWTVAADTTKTNNFSGSVEMKVLTAFGAAIDDKVGNGSSSGSTDDDGMGSDDAGIPIQIRTIDQLQYLKEMGTTAGTSYRNIEYFGIKHDITGRKLENTYVPFAMNVNRFNGFGYRIMDLNIEPVTGDAALFSTVDEGNSIENIILYSTDGKGRITSKDGNAAGILATTRKGSVTNCVVSGYTISGKNYVGGIIGNLSANGVPVVNCQAIVTLDGMNSAKGIGGIAGRAQAKVGSGGKIESCYAGGKIINANSSSIVGGIFGEQKDMEVSGAVHPVTGCYSYMDLRDSTNNGTKYAIGQVNKNSDNIDDTCYYLTEYATGANTTNQGSAVDFDAMCGKQDGKDAKYVYVPYADDPIDGITSWDDGAYPMAAVVKVGVHAGVDTGVDKTGEVLVHYGEWPYCARAAGIAYWEKVDGEYKIQIVGADFYGNKLYKNAASELYGDELCEDHHVDASGKITEHEITDSGYAVFTTNSALAVTAEGLPAKEVTSTDDKNGVVAAINKALGGACLSGGTKVYSNNDVVTGSVKTATVKHDGTEVAGVTLNYNPGMSGVSYDTFGVSTNPVPIRTVRQLDDIPSTCNKHFKQTHDLYGKDYASGGKAKYTGAVDFAGKYNGQSYKILDLSMNGDEKNVGLFASTNNATLNNIILYSPDGSASIRGTGHGSANNNYYGVGGIVGNLKTNENNKIINCVVAGYIISGEDYVGGIVGYAFHGGTIANCASVNTIHGSVTENGTTTYANGVGGVVGGGDNYGSYAVKIYGCYAGGTIEECGTSKVVGGVYGRNDNSGSLTIKNCYVYVNMSGCSTANVYTISGDTSGSISNSYYLNDLNRYPTGSEIQGTPISYNDLTDSSKWGERFPDIADIDFEVKPDKATSSYVTHNKDAGDKDKKSDDGWTPVEKQTTTLPGFPFPEVAYKVDKDGKPDGYVHYGEWPATNTATTPTTPSKNPGKIGVFMGFDSDTTFDSSSDAVAYMFDENGMRYRLGTSNKGTTCSYLGLVIGGVEPTDSKLSGLQVIYFADGVEYDSGSLKGTVTSCYTYDSNSAKKATPANADEFGSYSLYEVSNGTSINTTSGAVVIASGANVLGTTGTAATIDANKVVGWFKLKELNDTKGKAPYTDPDIAQGNGVMSAAVPEGLMPEVLALPVNELAGEPVEEGETEEILPPDTPEEVTPEASALPVNELAGEPVEEGETGEILPPDTPDAIKPEEFTLPDPESTDDNGDDGHTEIIDIRVSVARVRRVR